MLAALLLGAAVPAGAGAQGAHDAGPVTDRMPDQAESAGKAARRFPQPVRVGDLIGRQVLEPSNHQGVLGRVAGVTRGADGALLLVLRYGGVLGWGTRDVAVPVDAAALLGQFVQIVDVTPEAVGALPTFGPSGAAGTGMLAPDDTIRMGLNRN